MKEQLTENKDMAINEVEISELLDAGLIGTINREILHDLGMHLNIRQSAGLPPELYVEDHRHDCVWYGDVDKNRHKERRLKYISDHAAEIHKMGMMVAKEKANESN
jgi:hypothetical protein